MSKDPEAETLREKVDWLVREGEKRGLTDEFWSPRLSTFLHSTAPAPEPFICGFCGRNGGAHTSDCPKATPADEDVTRGEVRKYLDQMDRTDSSTYPKDFRDGFRHALAMLAAYESDDDRAPVREAARCALDRRDSAAALPTPDPEAALVVEDATLTAEEENGLAAAYRWWHAHGDPEAFYDVLADVVHARVAKRGAADRTALTAVRALADGRNRFRSCPCNLELLSVLDGPVNSDNGGGK